MCHRCGDQTKDAAFIRLTVYYHSDYSNQEFSQHFVACQVCKQAMFDRLSDWLSESPAEEPADFNDEETD